MSNNVSYLNNVSLTNFKIVNVIYYCCMSLNMMNSYNCSLNFD